MPQALHQWSMRVEYGGMQRKNELNNIAACLTDTRRALRLMGRISTRRDIPPAGEVRHLREADTTEERRSLAS